jgi:hypothetical protein
MIGREAAAVGVDRERAARLEPPALTNARLALPAKPRPEDER